MGLRVGSAVARSRRGRRLRQYLKPARALALQRGRYAAALWNRSLAFGLVNIPVELHTAVRDHRPRFRMLHARDKSPVRFERVCIRDGKPVAWEDLVKGYEVTKGHFVVMTRDDFKAAAVEKTKTVDIIDFVQAEEIDDRC